MSQVIYSLLVAVNFIINILLIVVGSLSTEVCVYFSIATVLLTVWSIIKVDERRLTYSTALLLYLIVTQLGLVIPYVLLGSESVSNYSIYILDFLDSKYLPMSILLGALAINAFALGILISRKNRALHLCEQSKIDFVSGEHKQELFVGTALLSVVLLFFIYHILTGGMMLFSTYSMFMQSSAFKSGIYSYIQILFYVGTIYLAAAGNIKNNWKSWTLWVLIVAIFAFNGNKGEFMYSLLAVLGMSGVKGRKISGRMGAVILLLLFIVIPSITTLRQIGIAGNLSGVMFNAVEGFTEMGMQIRTTVVTLEGLANGKISHLYGMSYIQPIINILTPFSEHTVATAELSEMYSGWGYNQAAEGYLNFGVWGVVLYFILVGFMIGRAETNIGHSRKLAYLGTIVCILVNVTRNYFVFVPGQILIVTLIYIFALRIKFTWNRT